MTKKIKSNKNSKSTTIYIQWLSNRIQTISQYTKPCPIIASIHVCVCVNVSGDVSGCGQVIHRTMCQ